MLYLIVHYLRYAPTVPQYLRADYLVVLVSLEVPLRVTEYCYLPTARTAHCCWIVVLQQSGRSERNDASAYSDNCIVVSK